jgi:hypothetical protein
VGGVARGGAHAGRARRWPWRRRRGLAESWETTLAEPRTSIGASTTGLRASTPRRRTFSPRRRIQGLRPHGDQITSGGSGAPVLRVARPRRLACVPHPGGRSSARRAADGVAKCSRRAASPHWNAIWFCEWSFRTYYVEIASVHVVTALQSLLKVRRYAATAQFVTRVPALARAVAAGISGMTRRRADAFYNRRSRLVHGRGMSVHTFDPATRELAAMQRLLTTALRKAIEDRDFASMFTGPKIERRWHVWRRRPSAGLDRASEASTRARTGSNLQVSLGDDVVAGCSQTRHARKMAFRIDARFGPRDELRALRHMRRNCALQGR